MPVSTVIPGDESVIIEIERLGHRFLPVPSYDLEQLSRERRVQVRETAHYAPRDRVQQYAVQMEHSQFPSLVVTNDDQPWVLDGSTRLEALLLRKVRYYPVIVLEVEYNGRTTTSKTKAELRALAMTLNAANGLPLTPAETRDGVRDLITLGWKAEEIARAIGLKPASVTAVRKEIAAEKRLGEVGLSVNGVHGASLRALGNKDVVGLNNRPYKALAELAGAAGFNATEIGDAARAARATGSDDEQVAVIARLAVENGDRIRERELTGRAGPAPARQLRQHLGYGLRYEGRVQELLETDPACNELAVKTLERSIALYTELLEMQKPAVTA